MARSQDIDLIHEGDPRDSGRPAILRGLLVAVLCASLPATGHGDSGSTVSCYELKKDGSPRKLGIPVELIPDTQEQLGGSRFYLNLGVDLKDFSPASDVPVRDEALANPDWSITKYGVNPYLVIVSVQGSPPNLGQVKSGEFPEIASDMPRFRRFRKCADCGIDFYLPSSASDIELITCFLPASETDRLTGCLVDQDYGSARIRYSIPYILRKAPEELFVRIQSLLRYFEDLGRQMCP